MMFEIQNVTQCEFIYCSWTKYTFINVKMTMKIGKKFISDTNSNGQLLISGGALSTFACIFMRDNSLFMLLMNLSGAKIL